MSDQTAVGKVRTILVVDDEEPVRTVLTRILERGGYRVIEASGGRLALDLYKQHFEEIDVVLLDLTMPDLPGEEVLAQLRRLSRTIRVILCTGRDRAEAEERIGGALDAVGFVHKPFRPQDLYGEIAHVLGE